MSQLLGLGPTAVAVLRLAFQRPTWSSDELLALASEHGIAAADASSCLLELLERGLMRAEGGARMRVMEPRAVLSPALTAHQHELAQRHRDSQEAAALVAALEEEYASTRHAVADWESERLRDVNAVRARLVEIAKSARKEVLTFIPFGAQAPTTMEASRPLDAAALARGVLLRTVYLHSIANDAPTLAYVRWLTERGAEIRTAPALPTRMLIVDREVAVVATDAADSSRGAVVVRSQGVLAVAVALFEVVWRDARSLSDHRARTQVDLDSTEREVLRLLALGYTDDVVGRKLGVSTRTVRRLVAGLQQRLGVHSRFQLGCVFGRSSIDAGDAIHL